MSKTSSIFSRIVTREIPAEIVFESDSVIAFHDSDPQAPVHILVVPKTELYRNVTELAAGDPALLAELVATAQQIATEHSDGHYRLTFNTGGNAGQTIFHVHAHVLSGALRDDSLGF
ncbi:MAG: HIT domain-containing protein [Rhodoglobus sp.]